jgi:hypothetical protein
MIADDLDDLHQKINKKFIRNVIKPMEQMQRRSDDLPFQIPSASELFGYSHASADMPTPRGGSLPVPRHPRDEHAVNAGMGVGHASNYGTTVVSTGQSGHSGHPGHVPFQPEAYHSGGYGEETPRRPPPRRMLRSPESYVEGYHSPPMATRIQATPTPTMTPTPVPEPMNCVSICTHVKSCPVCSQLYRPYTGIYLAVIVILIIVILFLLKKIFQF